MKYVLVLALMIGFESAFGVDITWGKEQVLDVTVTFQGKQYRGAVIAKDVRQGAQEFTLESPEVLVFGFGFGGLDRVLPIDARSSVTNRICGNFSLPITNMWAEQPQTSRRLVARFVGPDRAELVETRNMAVTTAITCSSKKYDTRAQ